MIDHKIDEQLKRLSRAIADTSPEPPTLTTESPRRTGFRPVRAVGWGFSIALVIGLATVLVATQWPTGPKEPTASAGAGETTAARVGDQSRWDWIMEHSAPTANQDLRVADPSATPVPNFDYADLGVEQHLIRADPVALAFNPMGGDDTPLLPFVYVGKVADTEASAYLFRANVDRISISRSLLCFAVAVPDGGSVGCEHERPAESIDPDYIISGTSLQHAGTPPGVSIPDLIVNFAQLPLDTALVVLSLDDGRTFVQRPVIGSALIVIDDLGNAGIDYAELLDTSGQVIAHEDFQAAWEHLEEDSIQD